MLKIIDTKLFKDKKYCLKQEIIIKLVYKILN